MNMPRGVEMMVKSLAAMLGINGDQLMLAVEDIRKSLHTAAAEMTTIRRQNLMIMAHLGIVDNSTEGLENVSGSELGRGGPETSGIPGQRQN